MFISFEGPDGAGKTTQIAILADRLKAEGMQVVTTREPGGTAIGACLRSLLLDATYSITPATEALLMTADRAEHVAQVIRPALAAGSIVVSDRYLDSTLAYQGGGRRLDVELLASLQQLATGGLLPDLTLLLDLPVEDGIRRKYAGDDLNRLDREAISFHQRVAASFRSLASQDSGRWRVIDATQDARMVHTAIWSHVSAYLEARRSAVVRGETG